MQNCARSFRSCQAAMIAFAIFLILFGASASHALTIDFEDLGARRNFWQWGIESTYQGYEWGFGHSPGLAGAIIPMDSTAGWASMTAISPGSGSMPTGGSGTSAAWNWGGAQSLWIDFGEATDFDSALFAVFSSTFENNSSTVQLFGYDASFTPVASSPVFNLSNTFQQLTANFSGIHALEIRSNADATWFSVDDLVLTASVPEPSTALLMLSGLIVIEARKRRRA